jgi:hypothetical protein
MDAERRAFGSEPDALAVVLAAIGELEAEALVAKRGGRAPHAADVVKRLEQEGITMQRADVVAAVKVAISEFGLATGVLAPGEDGLPDARSLHVTMAGVRWLRNEVRRERAPGAAPAAEPSPPSSRPLR